MSISTNASPNPDHVTRIAIVSMGGRITSTNQAWPIQIAAGGLYHDLCDAAGMAANDAAHAKAGIARVLAGTLPEFILRHAQKDGRWSTLTATGIEASGGTGCVISHRDLPLADPDDDPTPAGTGKRFRAMFDNAAVGIAEITPDGTWLRVNARLARMTGHSTASLLATRYHDLTHPDDVDADLARIAVMRAGADDSFSLDKRCSRRDGSFIWVTATLSCVRAENGGIEYIVAIIEDATERKLAEERQRTLLRELAHRGKNLMAVIKSVAARSLSGTRTLTQARDAFNGRLQALAQTFNVLTHETFDGARMDVLLRHELAAFGGRVILDGPVVMLTVNATQTFALMAHELVTNAVKYGALSVAEGSLIVTWTVMDVKGETRLRFRWREENGPPVRQPMETGFGTTLITRVAAHEFACRIDLVYDIAGFRCGFDAPLSRLGVVPAASPVRRRLKSPLITAFYDTWSLQRGAGEIPPDLSKFDWGRFAATGALTIAVIETGGALRFARIGRALIEELGRPPYDRDLTEDETIGMAEVYQLCADKAEPTHELLRFKFSETDTLTFERLLVPFSATSGRSVTHVAGIVVYDGHTKPIDLDT